MGPFRVALKYIILVFNWFGLVYFSGVKKHVHSSSLILTLRQGRGYEAQGIRNWIYQVEIAEYTQGVLMLRILNIDF